MAVYRVDLLTGDPYPVFDWIRANVADEAVVRRVGYRTVRGWYMKLVLKRQEDAEAFHRRWHPGADDHTVEAWASR